MDEMAPRPSKRQRKLTDSTVDEHGQTSGLVEDLTPSNADKFPASLTSPRKAKQRDNKRVSEAKRVSSKQLLVSPGSTRGIPSFFNSVTSSLTSPPRESCTLHPSDKILKAEDDDIEDEPSVEVTTPASRKTRPSSSSLSSSQLFPSKTHAKFVTRNNQESKKFINLPVIANTRISATADSVAKDDQCTGWADMLAPVSLNELAINPKKVATLRAWLFEATNDNKSHKALLIVKGPPGCGKSTAVRTIALSLGIKLLEWHNPIGSTFGSEGYVSFTNRFEEFLNRGLQYASLETASGEKSVQGYAENASESASTGRGLILIEDIPNVFSQDSTALTAFRNSLLKFVTARTMKQSYHEGVYRQMDRNVPIVLVLSESPRTDGSSGSDLLTAGRLLGQEILRHVSTSIVEINPVASAAMNKALNLIIQKRTRRFKNSWIPPPALLRSLNQSGDIRNAIGNLELFHTNSPGHGRTRGHQISEIGQPRSQRNHFESSSTTHYNIEFRENSIEFFHAVAKVMYNKRNVDKTQIPGVTTQHISQPPSYLGSYTRLVPSEVSSEQLFDTMDADIETFIAALHENYIASCAGSDFVRTFDACAEGLSTADILKPASRFSVRPNQITHRNYFGLENLDASKLNELTFHAAVRGLLFALPSPVNRAASVSAATKGVRDPFKMVYPALYKVLRQVEEAEEALTICTNAVAAFSLGQRQSLEDQLSSKDLGEAQRARPPLERSELDYPRSKTTRADMILQYLPYLNILLCQAPQWHDFSRVARLVNFSLSPFEPVYGSNLMDEELAPGPSRLEDQLGKSKCSGSSRLNDAKASGMHLSETTQVGWEQLILGDDDIES